MANINSYPTATPKRADLLLGTSMPADGTNDDPKTRNFSLGAVSDLSQLGYTIYAERFSQASTDAPQGTALQNTTGMTFTWSRQDPGKYRLTASGGTLTANTYIVVSNYQGATTNPASAGTACITVKEINLPGNYVEFEYMDAADGSLVDVLQIGFLEIRIYA